MKGRVAKCRNGFRTVYKLNLDEKAEILNVPPKGWLPNAKLKKYKKELSDLGATWVS